VVSYLKSKAYIHLSAKVTLKRVKYSYMAVIAVGIFFIVLGIYSIVHYFTAVYNVPYSHSVFGVRYVVAGGGCIAIGIGAFRLSIPAFIPIKQNSLPTVSTCPYCGAVTETDATCCKKCKRELD
jgi:hypothetical protein